MIGVKFVEFALPILQWGNNIRQMLYSMRRGWLCTPLSNRTVWRTKVTVNGSAVLAKAGAGHGICKPRRNRSDRPHCCPLVEKVRHERRGHENITYEDVYEKVDSFEIKVLWTRYGQRSAPAGKINVRMYARDQSPFMSALSGGSISGIIAGNPN
jgi:hypothetical protein